LTELTFD